MECMQAIDTQGEARRMTCTRVEEFMTDRLRSAANGKQIQTECYPLKSHIRQLKGAAAYLTEELRVAGWIRQSEKECIVVEDDRSRAAKARPS